MKHWSPIDTCSFIFNYPIRVNLSTLLFPNTVFGEWTSQVMNGSTSLISIRKGFSCIILFTVCDYVLYTGHDIVWWWVIWNPPEEVVNLRCVFPLFNSKSISFYGIFGVNALLSRKYYKTSIRESWEGGSFKQGETVQERIFPVLSS